MLDDVALAGMEARRLPGPLDGRPFVALLHDDDQQRDAALSRLLSELARPDVRVVRMGNSMRSRLMLEHILIQVSGTDGKVSQEEAARRIARAIAERQGRERRVVLLITQAETLHSKTLRLLQAMQPFFAEHGAPTLQVVFVGRPAFQDLLDGRGMTPLREALGFQPQAEAARPPSTDGAPVPEADLDLQSFLNVQDPGQPDVPADPAAEDGVPHWQQAGHSGPTPTLPLRPIPAGRAVASVRAAQRRRSLALGLAVFAAVALAAYVGLHAAFYEKVQARAVPGVPHPTGSPLIATPPALPVPGPASPAQAAPSDPGRSVPPPAARRGPDTPEPSSPPPRESAPAPASPAPRVVIHVPAGSEGAEAMSAHLRAGLGLRLGAVAARRVAGAPDRPSIRFFHPGDEPVAQQVAAWMVDTGLIWTLQDFSGFSPRPSRGTIEVWLPRS